MAGDEDAEGDPPDLERYQNALVAPGSEFKQGDNAMLQQTFQNNISGTTLLREGAMEIGFLHHMDAIDFIYYPELL